MLEKIRDINKMYHQKKIHDHNIDIGGLYSGTKKPALLAGFLLIR
ncbi:conserved hypothetical protein [Vibrio crassostreae]|nr:conserved hypothetical protein [Vibrio crassostreae]CAK1734005.1 conserved hypothetical protein [Vibrio crassostreae]CAK1734811.1 conserved hypothetical protein [Vibrio crassostreae]CAK1735074.1 conserved hypothetical protein [Vibrio crassostreae]CAK1735295.1 conserved hypothetical protein [Vibrio crassostreae]